MIDIKKRYLDMAKYHKKCISSGINEKEKKHHEKMYNLYLHLANKEETDDEC